ncbi:ATP-binding cassette domain-containing protein [bacterium]|nr:ATP-binding cassette domain-containing protein [bacterium]
MRKGTVIGTFETGGISESELAQTLLGRQPLTLKKNVPAHEPSPVLRVHKVSSTPMTGMGLNQLSLVVRSHEIVGIAGIEGQGQEELVRILAQLHPFEGSIEFLEEPLNTRKRYQNRQRGFGIIPPDRQEEGLILNFSAADNLILGHHRELPFYSKGIRHSQAIEAHAQHQFTQFEITPKNIDLPASAFSGGNQQKLVISRETQIPLRFLLACHPTRGVDLGAMEHIHQHLVEMANNGLGILLISSDLDELLKLSHRVLVLREGAIVYQEDAEKITFSDLGLWITGARK